MSQSLILIYALSSAGWEKGKKKKRKEKWLRVFFSPGLGMPCWLCHLGFLWLSGAVKV
jgi:hypothetical protein